MWVSAADSCEGVALTSFSANGISYNVNAISKDEGLVLAAYEGHSVGAAIGENYIIALEAENINAVVEDNIASGELALVEFSSGVVSEDNILSFVPNDDVITLAGSDGDCGIGVAGAFSIATYAYSFSLSTAND